MTTPLEDSDSMPFGKYKGESMDSIPASYLHWLWTNGKKHECKTCPVAGYIKNNRAEHYDYRTTTRTFNKSARSND